MGDTRQELAEHPGLRLKVYRVDSVTLERSRAVEKRAKPSKAPMMTSAYPPCECPRCGRPRGGRR